jgi:hypothetical protein
MQTERDKLNAEFRELAMHGSVVPAMQIAAKCDVHQVEATSGRSALHKAAFWGHNKMVEYLLNETLCVRASLSFPFLFILNLLLLFLFV